VKYEKLAFCIKAFTSELPNSGAPCVVVEFQRRQGPAFDFNALYRRCHDALLAEGRLLAPSRHRLTCEQTRSWEQLRRDLLPALPVPLPTLRSGDTSGGSSGGHTPSAPSPSASGAMELEAVAGGGSGEGTPTPRCDAGVLAAEVSRLADMLTSGFADEAKQGVRQLAIISGMDCYRASLVASPCGAVERLVEQAQSGGDKCLRRCALSALANLCQDEATQGAVLRAGLLPLAVQLCAKALPIPAPAGTPEPAPISMCELELLREAARVLAELLRPDGAHAREHQAAVRACEGGSEVLSALLRDCSSIQDLRLRDHALRARDGLLALKGEASGNMVSA